MTKGVYAPTTVEMNAMEVPVVARSTSGAESRNPLRHFLNIAGALGLLLTAVAVLDSRTPYEHGQPAGGGAITIATAVELSRSSPVSPPATDATRESQVRPFAVQRSATPAGRWLVNPAPVLVRGDLGQWDDFKVGFPVVLKDGSGLRMWYRGCHLFGMTYSCAIGHATSPDGVSWKKAPSAVLAPGDPIDSRRLHSLTVVRAGDYYWMWYSIDPDRYAGRPYAAVHLATSRDGIAWTARGPVLRAMSGWTPSLEPSAHFDGKLFHLWYTDYPNDDDRTLIHVTSADGATWQQSGAMSLRALDVRPGRLWVVSKNEGYRAFFSAAGLNESEFGALEALTSSDGNLWQRAGPLPKLRRAEIDPRGGIALAPYAVPESDGTLVWLTVRPQSGAEEIRLAFLKGG